MTLAPHEAQVLTTPFHARTSALCQANAWAHWAGYTTVNVYSQVEREYSAIRNAAGLIDISPMVKYAISGPDAVRFLNRLVTRDVGKLGVGRVGYAVWCNDDGKVIDDGTVFRLAENSFRLCSQERHLPWLLDTALGFEVAIEDVTEQIAAVALQGPTSCAILKAMGLEGVESLKPNGLADFAFDGRRVEVSRTGFTGDLGYELWAAPDDALALWDALMGAGALHGVQPAGNAALDMTRIEAGFIQANAEFFAGDLATRPDRLRSPFELGLGWMVDFGKGHFVGRRALAAERDSGSRYALVGLDVEGNKPAADAFLYKGRAKEVGVVTSAMWSPAAKRNIALASIRVPHDRGDRGLWADVYYQRELKWDRIAASCKIVDKRFFNPPRRTATPPGDW